MKEFLRISRLFFVASLLTTLIFVGCASEDPATPPREPGFTAEEIFAQVIAPQNDNDQILADLFTSGMDTMAAMDSVLVLFLEDPAVAWGEVGEQGIALSYHNGMVGGIFLDPQDNPEMDPDFPELRSGQPHPHELDGSKATPKKAIFLNPHYNDRVTYAERIIENYNLNLTLAGYSALEIYKNSEVTLDSYTHLTDHRIVHIYSHGWAWPARTNIQEVYLLSGEYWSPETYLKYWDDIERGEVPLVRVHGSGTHFFVSPDFIHKHNSLDDDTMFYGGFCYSGLGSWPARMAEDAGVGGYFGFDWSVWTSWNAAWNINCVWNLLDDDANPRITVNDWLNSSFPKYYQAQDRTVHVTYAGDQTLILFDEPTIPCSETVEEHDDVWVHAKVTVHQGSLPGGEVPVRIDYQKIHCDGHLGSIDPVFGETQPDGVYVANITASFHLDNTQDLIVVKATVGGLVQEKIYHFSSFNGMDGGSIFFPMRAEFVFNF